MSASFQLDFHVRDYELDQFGVVNNAVYLNYLEHTRHAFLITLGIIPSQAAKDNQSLALSEIHLRFYKSLLSDQTFTVYLQVASVRGARLNMDQQITCPAGSKPDQKQNLVLTAQATAVFLNQEGKPTRISQDLHQKLEKALS